MKPELTVQVQHILTENTDKFILSTEKLMKEDGLNHAFGRNGLGRTQFESLMQITSKAGSLEELLLFLSYQESKGIGRQSPGWAWICQRNPQKTAAQITIDSLRVIVDEIIAILPADIRQDSDALRLVKLKIAEKHLGYLYWRASIASRGA